MDILVLLATEPDLELSERIQRFIQQLWDLGLDIGHSVRTVDACVEEAARELRIWFKPGDLVE